MSRLDTSLESSGAEFLVHCHVVTAPENNPSCRMQIKSRWADDDSRREPRFFVFPVAVIQTAQVPGSAWGKVFLRHIEDYESYENRWALIAEFLDATP